MIGSANWPSRFGGDDDTRGAGGSGYDIRWIFKFMIAQGESGKINEAKNTVINAIIGLVIVIIATQSCIVYCR